MVHTMTQMAVPEKSGQAGINEGGFILRPVLRSLLDHRSFNEGDNKGGSFLISEAFLNSIVLTKELA